MNEKNSMESEIVTIIRGFKYLGNLLITFGDKFSNIIEELIII